MKLSEIRSEGCDVQAWADKGYELPKFDLEAVRQKTHDEPTWIHFGAGNIFRAFPAALLQRVLDAGAYDRGVIVAEGFDYEIIDKAYRPYDNMSLLVLLKSDGSIEKRVVASVTESLKADPQFGADWDRLVEIFRKPSLQMVSFTITEKGYSVSPADLERGAEPQLIMGKVTALLYERYQAGALPITVQSMDNCSHNGDKVRSAAMAYAEAWVRAGLVPQDFLDYLKDESKVSFPWSMIDKITPRPDAKVEAMLAEDHIGGLDAVVTSKNTYIAPFVNAEECEYLVIEDAFPNGKPALDKGGIIFTDRATVDKVEKMKVCTCLNPLHTALAIYGCLLGYTLISEEMKNPLLKNMVEVIGYKEGLPVVVNPGILDPKKFIDEVVNVRIPNPFLPDSPQRIATDTSQKLSIRFGETIKAYEASPDLHTEDLKLIPLVYAGWLRYLMGIDDEGREFTPSSDPLLEEARQYVADYELSSAPKDLSKLDALLANEKIFGVNLHAIGMDTLVKQYFAELSSGVGAVAAALKKYVPEKVTL